MKFELRAPKKIDCNSINQITNVTNILEGATTKKWVIFLNCQTYFIQLFSFVIWVKQ